DQRGELSDFFEWVNCRATLVRVSYIQMCRVRCWLLRGSVTTKATRLPSGENCGSCKLLTSKNASGVTGFFRAAAGFSCAKAPAVKERITALLSETKGKVRTGYLLMFGPEDCIRASGSSSTESVTCRIRARGRVCSLLRHSATI